MDSVLELLLDHGSLGLFAAFLIWLYTSMQKRMDSLVDRFQDQLENIRSDQKSDVEDLRNRYDSVIKNYNQERTHIRVNIKDKVNKVMLACGAIDTKLTDVLIRQETTRGDLDDIRSNMNALLEMTRQMQTEQRIRDLAKIAGASSTTPPAI
jgi:hypothetical protein